jgi:hypothetical protein
MTDKCTVSIGSITYASKAQKALSSASIFSEIVKTERSGLSGCIYGLEFSCSQLNNVRTVLEHAGIRAKRSF